MKIGIFTFPNSISYGATLQMCALCRVVKRLGHDAEAINYHNAFMRAELHCKSNTKSKLKYFFKKVIKRVLHGKMYRNFKKFESKATVLYPKKRFTDMSKLPMVGIRYDAVICGSDQVWNPNITGGDLSYFLDFCGHTTRRISYAPSFGVEFLQEDFATQVQKELRQFSSLSVRELQGQALVTELIGKEVPVVIDPTMLLEADEWRQMEIPYSKVDGEYVLYFTVSTSKPLYKKCWEFAKKQGLKMVVIGGNYLSAFKNNDPTVQYAIDISPAEWLWLVDHARYVVTNSFHGTAFSILFEKDFFLELSAKTNSRLSNIVRILALEDRILPAEADMLPFNTDYTTTRKNLLRLREESLEYLRNALSEDVSYG